MRRCWNCIGKFGRTLASYGGGVHIVLSPILLHFHASNHSSEGIWTWRDGAMGVYFFPLLVSDLLPLYFFPLLVSDLLPL